MCSIGNEREVVAMEMGGNRIINEAYEAKMSAGSKVKKLTPSSEMDMRNTFVKKKYSDKKFLDATKFVPAGKEDLFAGFQQSMFDDQPSTATTTTISSPTKDQGFFFQSGGIDLLVSPSPKRHLYHPKISLGDYQPPTIILVTLDVI